MNPAHLEDAATITHAAGCHCGNLRASLGTRLPMTEWSLRRCRCGFCRGHGALWTSDPRGRLFLHAPASGPVIVYRFGQGTADFQLCGICGVLIAATMETAGGRVGILNVRCLDPAAAVLPAAVDVEYDRETAAERRLRRESNWTPCFSG